MIDNSDNLKNMNMGTTIENIDLDTEEDLKSPKSLEPEIDQFCDEMPDQNDDFELLSSSESDSGSEDLDFSMLSNVEYNSPFKVSYGNGEEYIDPENGVLKIVETDFMLPGKNGLDFSFSRYYDSSESFLEEWFHSRIKGKRPISRDYDPFDLGVGWYFDIPFIITDWVYSPVGVPKNPIYISLGSMGIFKLRETSSHGARENITYDIEKLEGATFLIPERYSYYSILTMPNGDTYHFNDRGHVYEIQNKYGDKIEFIYEANSKKIEKIIDTVGRKILFTHSDTMLIVTVYESDSSPNVLNIWKYQKEVTEYTKGWFSTEYWKKLTKVIPPIGKEIVYNYENSIARMWIYFPDVTYVPMPFHTMLLTSIKKPSEMKDIYEYEVYENHNEDWETIQQLLKWQLYRVKKRYSEIPSCNLSQSNKNNILKKEDEKVFTYNSWGYPKKGSSTLIEFYDDNMVSIRQELLEFDKYHRIVSKSITTNHSGEDRNTEETINTFYEYVDANYNFEYEIWNAKGLKGFFEPIFIKEQTKLEGVSEEKLTEVNYMRDKNGNIILQIDSNGNVIQREYDLRYNMLIKEIKRNGINIGIVVDNVLDSSGKNVISSKTSYIDFGQRLSYATHRINNIALSHNINYSGGRNNKDIFMRVPKIITSVRLKINYTTIATSGTVYYRKVGDKEWTIEANFDSKFSGQDLMNINFPSPDYYEIKISSNFKVEVDSDRSYAYEAHFKKIADNSDIYTTYEYDYDCPGNLTAINLYPLGATFGNPEVRKTYVYDPLWNAYLSEIIFQKAGGVALAKNKVEYDKLGRIMNFIKEENEIAAYTSYKYDELGRVIKIINSPLDLDSSIYFKTIEYIDSERRVEITDEIGNKIGNVFDGMGRNIYSEWQDSDGNWHLTSHDHYDSLGRLSHSYDAAFNETIFEYDKLGRQIKTIYADNLTSEIWYVNVPMQINETPFLSLTPPIEINILPLGSWEKYKDREDNRTYKWYDLQGRLQGTAVNPKNSFQGNEPTWEITWYEYDLFDRVTKVAINRTSSDWDITEYEYSYNGKVSSFKNPLTMKVPGNTEPKYIYEYNARGLKIKEYQENTDNSEINYIYDELGRIKQIVYPSKEEVRYTRIEEPNCPPEEIIKYSNFVSSENISFKQAEHRNIDFTYDGREGQFTMLFYGSNSDIISDNNPLRIHYIFYVKPFGIEGDGYADNSHKYGDLELYLFQDNNGVWKSETSFFEEENFPFKIRAEIGDISVLSGPSGFYLDALTLNFSIHYSDQRDSSKPIIESPLMLSPWLGSYYSILPEEVVYKDHVIDSLSIEIMNNYGYDNAGPMPEKLIVEIKTSVDGNLVEDAFEIDVDILINQQSSSVSLDDYVGVQVSNSPFKIDFRVPFVDLQESENNLFYFENIIMVMRVYYEEESENENQNILFEYNTEITSRRDKFYYGVYGLTKAESFINNDLESSIVIGYNSRGWITEEIWHVDDIDYSFKYTYDASGNRLTTEYPDNNVISYDYDEIHRIKNISEFFENNNFSGFVYDVVGNLTDVYSVNGIHTQYGYNNRNMVTSISSSSQSNIALALEYIYTSKGNIGSIVDSTSGTPVTYNYTYDAKGQLKTAEMNSKHPLGKKKVSYSYDGVGNRLQETWCNSADEMIKQYDYQYSPGSYLLSRIGMEDTEDGLWLSSTNLYTWDQYGNLDVKNKNVDQVGNTQLDYVFNSKNQLNAVLENGVPIEIYIYDTLGRRLKSVNITDTTINFARGNDSGYEIKVNTLTRDEISATKYISANGKYLAKVVKENGLIEENYFQYFHHVDIVGSIKAITDIDGNIVASYEYEPFGLITNATGTDSDNLGFTGKRLDSGSDLSYFGARYYDSEIGRFISRDPAFDGRNWFVYCNNNPLIYVDPSGLEGNLTTPSSLTEKLRRISVSLLTISSKDETFTFRLNGKGPYTTSIDQYGRIDASDIYSILSDQGAFVHYSSVQFTITPFEAALLSNAKNLTLGSIAEKGLQGTPLAEKAGVLGFFLGFISDVLNENKGWSAGTYKQDVEIVRVYNKGSKEYKSFYTVTTKKQETIDGIDHWVDFSKYTVFHTDSSPYLPILDQLGIPHQI